MDCIAEDMDDPMDEDVPDLTRSKSNKKSKQPAVKEQPVANSNNAVRRSARKSF